MKTITMLKQVRAYCLYHGLLEPGLVIVAVSGGADSLALLHVLLSLQSEFGISAHVATLDHGIRGVAGAEDAQFAGEIAASWGVPFTARLVDVPALARQWHTGLEEAARRARYAFLEEVATNLNATMIAIGHNRDDQAETVLLHVIRGSGLAGLRGMLPKSPLSTNGKLSLIRPLLATPRADIEAYLNDLGIQPRSDATNLDTHYTRNRLRHTIMPQLAEINPQISSALARTAATLQEDYTMLVSALPPLKPSSSDLSLDRTLFLALHVAQQRLLIREAVRGLAPDTLVSFERIEAAIALAKSSTPRSIKIPLGGKLWFSVTDTDIAVRATPGDSLPFPEYCPFLEPSSSITMAGPGSYSLPNSPWQLHVEPLQTATLPSTDPLSAILVIGMNQKLELRTRLRGDQFRPFGLGGHSQKLKETLINLKIPSEWRDHVPLLTVDGEVAWFVAPTDISAISRISDTFAVYPGDSRPVLRFIFMPLQEEYSPQ